MEMRFVYITCKNVSESVQISRGLLEKKLVACTNILSGMKSMYWWKGEIVEDNECVLVAKTQASKMEDLIEEVQKLHNYDVPCVISWALEESNPAYLKWLAEAVQN
ncbi:MAG: divalent-cation tolerance protein CutA [Bacteroidota bacterium]